KPANWIAAHPSTGRFEALAAAVSEHGSSRETELAESFPIHVVAEWLGNSPKTALAHYTQVTEEHYQRAAESGAPALQNPVQQHAASPRNVSQDSPQVLAPCDSTRGGAIQDDLRQERSMTPTGFEPVSRP